MTIVKNENYGFSLVELSIVLVIISSILGSMMILTTQSQVQTTYRNTIEKIKIIDKTLNNFALKSGALPCPARRDDTLTSINFGNATICSAAVVAGVTEVGQVRIGVVPTRTLGLTDDFMFDEWGMRITYAVNKNLAIDSATLAAYNKPVAGGILIQDANGNSAFDVNAALTKTFPAYIIISHGLNKNGATNKAGTNTLACSGTANDVLNCGNTGTFRDTSIKLIGKTNNAYFDDVVTWRPYDYIDLSNYYTNNVD